MDEIIASAKYKCKKLKNFADMLLRWFITGSKEQGSVKVIFKDKK